MDSNWTYHIGLRSPNLTNTTVSLQENFEIDLEDTNWILTSSFIIFTMQTGKCYTVPKDLRKTICLLLMFIFFTRLRSPKMDYVFDLYVCVYVYQILCSLVITKRLNRY